MRVCDFEEWGELLVLIFLVLRVRGSMSLSEGFFPLFFFPWRAGWLAGFAGGQPRKWIHGWTNRTFSGDGRCFWRSGWEGGFLLLLLHALSCSCTTVSVRDFQLSCDTGRIWIMSSLGGLRNIWYWFVFRTAFDGSIFSESAYYLFPLPDLLS